MRGRIDQALYRSVLSLCVLAIIIAIFCAQANAVQLVNLPKYDVQLTLEQNSVGPGGKVHVTSHVTLLYFQMGKDPSVPDIYVDYEIKSPSGDVTATSAGGNTNGQGLHYADITMPSAPGEYTIIARAYDIPGGPVNGQNEARVTVTKGPAVTESPATPTPVAGTPLPPTVPPVTPVPQPSNPVNRPLVTTELLIIGAVVVALLFLLLVIAAVVAFILLRRRRKPAPVTPAVPAAPPAVPTAPRSRFCMHCGAAMAMDAEKCPKCGLTPPSDIDTRACSNCGTVLPAPAAKFCYNCGVEQKYPEKGAEK